MHFFGSPTKTLACLGFITCTWAATSQSNGLPPLPPEEPVVVRELQLPPVISSTAVGACTFGFGCIGQTTGLQSGGFTPDGQHIVAIVNFVGAPNASVDAAASLYSGLQAILISTDSNATFANGQPWRCITCGVPAQNQVGRNAPMDYPNVFTSGKRLLIGTNIVECSGELITSDACTPEKTFIYPIRWSNTANDSGLGGAMRELRIHPDDLHLGWSSMTAGGQNAFTGRLRFNAAPTTGVPLSPRYDLVDVNLLADSSAGAGSPITVSDNGHLSINRSAIGIGELRGFGGTGREVLYIGYPTESCNIDVYAIDSHTAAIRRLTNHPEYVDPVDLSSDDSWTVVMDTRTSGRQMFMAGMRGIPPLIDIVATAAVASTRNNGDRRFFQPWIVDQYGERGDYIGQQLNAGDGGEGSVSDPNWNGRADPLWSPDGTHIVYWQALVVPPACGGDNSLPCPNSTAEGGRTERVMLAHLTSRQPLRPQNIVTWPDVIVWATPYKPGDALPVPLSIPAGNYTLFGQNSGFANVTLTENSSGLGIGAVGAIYHDFSDDDGTHVLNGNEEVIVNHPSVWINVLDWTSNITQTGEVNGMKMTTPGGFHLEIDVMTNIFNATGNLTTTLDGVVYVQPQNNT